MILEIVRSEILLFLSYWTRISTSLSDLSSPREDDPNSQALSIGCPVRNCWIFGIMFFTLSLTIVEMLCFLLTNIGYSFEICKNILHYFLSSSRQECKDRGGWNSGATWSVFLARMARILRFFMRTISCHRLADIVLFVPFVLKAFLIIVSSVCRYRTIRAFCAIKAY